MLAMAFAAVVAGAFLPTATFAAEWFVSPDGDNSAAGTSEAAPWRTIQYAVTSASANDTIILLPGDYAEGSATTTVGGNSTSRVVIDKKLTIRSRDGRDKTRIVGAWDTTEYSDLPWGFGPNAVRCVWIDSTASGTRLEGITFYKGSVPAFASSSGGNTYGGGGGVLVNENATTATIVDCAFIDCQAFNGGGLCHSQQSTNVKAVRCLFRRCRGSKFGTAMRGGSAYNCVFDDNGRTRFKNGDQKVVTQMGNGGTEGAMSYPQYVVNCTFVNNDNYAIGTVVTTMRIYNCIFANNGYVTASTGVKTARAFSTSATYANCVSDISSITANNCTYVAFTTSSEVYSPFDGDYRLVADARSLTSGSATYLSYIPEEFRDTDFNGNARTTDGTVYCGAVQDVADAAASGVAVGYTADGDWYLDGEKLGIRSRTWKAAEGWPKPRHVKFVPADGNALVRFSFGGSTVWPLRDDSAWFTTTRAGQVQTVAATTTSNIFYADPVNGSDETGDGSEENPYRTLNKAVKKTTVNFVVRAKAGDYNEGGENYAGITNRVVVPQALAGVLRVVAVDGPEATFITGASATSGDTTHGTGPDAVRCIAVASTNAYYAAFQGFTLRDARTDGATASDAGTKTYGAAMYNSDPGAATNSLGTAHLLDCVITNCSGRRGGAIVGGSAIRCKFESCNSFNGGGGVLRFCDAVSSFFTNCGGSSQPFGPGASGYNCTLVADTMDSVYKGSYGTGYLYYCVTGERSGTFADINADATDANVKNTLYARLSASSTATFTTAVQENPLKLVDSASGDYRLASDSAGLYLASTSYMKSCMDIDGNPFLFDGTTYQAGCYASREGATLYVDAGNGSDANDGSSEASAFATLAAAMAAADYGDMVVALPGTYESGTMIQTLAQSGGSVEPSLPARVVVKIGVTLVSRDGAATTIIKGQASFDASAVADCGPGAVRGVFLCKNAVLRGFTVTGGATYLGSDSSATVNDYGGGVAAYAGMAGTDEEFNGLVENCVISNNAARAGGGGYYGTYCNCLFTANKLRIDKPGWAVSRAKLEGCFLYGNGISANHSTAYGCMLVNCTILGNQAGAAKGDGGTVRNENSTYRKRPMFNCIVESGYVKCDIATNCLFGSSVNMVQDTAIATNVVVAADLMLDANGVPLAGSPAIDAGDNALASAALLDGRDPAGTRRVLNGTIDVGAYEFNWGIPWGRAIGSKRLVIDDMPSGAAPSGGKLVFADGTVSMTWEKGQINAPYIYSVRVTGNGTLTVTVNGTVIGAYAATDGAKDLRFTSDLASNALQFTYVPGDGDTGGAELYGFTHVMGTIISFR